MARTFVLAGKSGRFSGEQIAEMVRGGERVTVKNLDEARLVYNEVLKGGGGYFRMGIDFDGYSIEQVSK